MQIEKVLPNSSSRIPLTYARLLLIGLSALQLDFPLPAQQSFRTRAQAIDGALMTARAPAKRSSAIASGAHVQYSIVSIANAAGRESSFMPEPQSINNAGVAAGYSYNGPFENGPQLYNETVPFIYKDGVTVTLPLLPGYPAAFAFGLNDNNQVYGEATAEDANDVIYKTAVLWDRGKPINLGTVVPNSYSFGAGVNNRGEVVANSVSNDTFLETAFLWRNGKQTILPVPDGVIQSAASWINDAGQIAGYLDLGITSAGFDILHACLWSVAGDHITVQDLGVLPQATFSIANYINNRSQLVGYATDASDYLHATYWFGGPAQTLPYLPGGDFGLAISLNEHGQVAGEATTAAGDVVPALWQRSGVFDLDDLVPAGTPPLLAGGGGINERGEITSSLMNLDGTMTAVILRPIYPNQD